MSQDIHFLNLTNGIESIGRVEHPHYVRIQSTALEQKRWGFVIAELGYDFLMHAALGYNCIIHDYSQRKDNPRAIYQGIPWIRYVLDQEWKGEATGPYKVRNHECYYYFDSVYRTVPDDDLRAVRYFKRFFAGDISIAGAPGRTVHDGDYEFYANRAMSSAPHQLVA